MRKLFKQNLKGACLNDSGLEERMNLLLSEVNHGSISTAQSQSAFKIIMENVHSAISTDYSYHRKAYGNGERVHLLRIIRALAAPLQAALIARPFLSTGDLNGPRENVEIWFNQLWFDQYTEICSEGSVFNLAYTKLVEPVSLNLAIDPMLAWPWKHSRIADTSAYIGSGRYRGEWRQDSNHSICVVLPVRIGLIQSGGNHSISTGVLIGEGQIDTADVCNLSSVYPHIACDGALYRRTDNGQTIAKVKNPVFAAIFEIGRLIDNLDRSQDVLSSSSH